ncbi:MAG: hypothetical protein DRH37_11895 [Deltaproteobacteria bacterium]|nr:MAG: hypothetical protein DRH37_11895 [Deltaproteobacteria bacterium]
MKNYLARFNYLCWNLAGANLVFALGPGARKHRPHGILPDILAGCASSPAVITSEANQSQGIVNSQGISEGRGKLWDSRRLSENSNFFQNQGLLKKLPQTYS